MSLVAPQRYNASGGRGCDPPATLNTNDLWGPSMSTFNRIEYQRRYRSQIVTITCGRCAAVFQSRRGQRKYCEPCGLAIRTAKFCAQTKATLVCRQCGADYQPGHLRRQFCSLACKGMASRNRPTAKRGKVFPALQRAAVRACLCCGTEFRAVKDTKRVKQVYCSHRCYLRNRRVSHFENRVMSLLEGAGLTIERTVRLGRWTFDGRVAGTAILIEADGDYWHRSEKVKERDRRKNDWCDTNGFTLYRVPELAFYRDPDAAVRVILRRAEAEGLTAEKVG